jgi:predicted SnoaL-like aldol condensation-catalyzing enzyme
MKAYGRLLLSTLLALGPCLASAQVPVSATQHETFLSSPDARLVRNKKLVYDFWREVVDAGQIDQIDKYVAENYIQHNPNVATGRLAEQIARNVKRQAAQAQIKAPVVAIVAEGNLVVVSLVSELPDPADSSKKYTTTWFDMFRIENGKIAEHWDSAVRLP